MNGQPVDAVVFDVGRVLYRWDMRLLFEKMTSDAARLEKILSEVVTEEWHYLHDSGQPLTKLVLDRIARFPDFSAEIHAYATRFNETIPGPVEGSHELVERLDTRGVPLFAITNFADAFWAGFRPQHAIFDRFREIVVSGVERIAKPDPAIFALSADRFGYAPEAMLFIDDNPDNIAAARDCGWQVHHFTDAELLESDLKARGLI
ncbi:HAD-IA family hydrolase [Erythrobacter vulgaris]|uniref:HAD-IA family hydrolase n=1 Tax=Qipengyuania vulgaris TaxID=291985 RepID=A0A844XTL8_9SPHN|nr:HAD-IA family hydrolase [Qipengyuania vulgaris]MXO48749.1 HAD-IA family hydrolase [Qipengyuania vulgaris]